MLEVEIGYTRGTIPTVISPFYHVARRGSEYFLRLVKLMGAKKVVNGWDLMRFQNDIFGNGAGTLQG